MNFSAGARLAARPLHPAAGAFLPPRTLNAFPALATRSLLPLRTYANPPDFALSTENSTQLIVAEQGKALQASVDRLESLKEAMLTAAQETAAATERRMALQGQFETALKSVLGQMQALFEAEPAMRHVLTGSYVQVNDVVAEVQRAVQQLTSAVPTRDADRKSLEFGALSLGETTKSFAVWVTQTDVGRFYSSRLKELQPAISLVINESADYLGMLRNQTSQLVAYVAGGADSVSQSLGLPSLQSQITQTASGLTEYLSGVYRQLPDVNTVAAGVTTQAGTFMERMQELASDKSWEFGLWTRKLTEDLQFTAWAYRQGSKIGMIKDPVIAEYHKARRQASKIWNRPDPWVVRVRGVAAVVVGLLVLYFRGIVHWISGWIFYHFRPLHHRSSTAEPKGPGKSFHLMRAGASRSAPLIVPATLKKGTKHHRSPARVNGQQKPNTGGPTIEGSRGSPAKAVGAFATWRPASLSVSATLGRLLGPRPPPAGNLEDLEAPTLPAAPPTYGTANAAPHIQMGVALILERWRILMPSQTALFPLGGASLLLTMAMCF